MPAEEPEEPATEPAPPDAPVTPMLVVPPRRPSAPRPDPIQIGPPDPARPPLAAWSAGPPPGYVGQLEPDFQRQLAECWADVQLEDCYFYHCVRLPDGSFVEGPWDLLDNELEYLGGIDVTGRSVLEFGPASGWLTLWMTDRGAEVVVLDIGWDLVPDLIPLATFDLETMRRKQAEFCARVVSAWWYLRREWGHSARAVYAPIYDLPRDLGRYDVAVFGSILLHLRDPFLALEQAAAFTDDTIVVVEPLSVPTTEVDRAVMYWNPTNGNNPNGWWNLSPAVVVDMLGVLGFSNATVSYHQQLYRPPDVPDSEPVEVTDYTVVARRH
jgi:hypothetical protein